MKRVNSILKNEKYINYIKTINVLERERIYCKHDYNHFMAVARIGYILILEKNYNIKKELIYGAALLHDIGRWKEYEEGLDHAFESAILAVDILSNVGFTQEEIDMIQIAIKEHRVKGQKSNLLSEILYKADKASRECFNCNAISSCKKHINKDQIEITITY